VAEVAAVVLRSISDHSGWMDDLMAERVKATTR